MEDTDWRPSPCPRCNRMREARPYPVCDNKQCLCYNLVGDVSQLQKEKPMILKRYVWMKRGKNSIIITDLKALYNNLEYDPAQDTIYELGPEIKIQMQIIAIPAHPVTRNHSWENKE